MLDDGAPGLSVGFEIDTGGAFNELENLQRLMTSVESRVVADAAKIERATGGMVKLGGGTASVRAFGSAFERETAAAARATIQVERSIEGMIRSLSRQAETYGMTTAQARAFRIEQKAIEAESRELTEAAARARALGVEMARLDKATSGAAGSVGATRSAMSGLSFQAQDAFTQISMGANAFSVLAIQGGQAAGQMAGMGGALGKVANFLIGPWGLALTAGTLVLGALTSGMFDSEEAAKKTGDANETLADKLDLTKHSMEEVIEASRAYNREQEQSRVTTLAAAQASVEKAKANLQEARTIRVKLAAELASRQGEFEAARSQTFGAAGGAGAGMAQVISAGRVSEVSRLIKENDTALAALGTTAKNAINEVATVQAKIATDRSYAVEQDFMQRRADAAVKYAGNVDALTAAYSRLADEEKKALKDAEPASAGRASRRGASNAEREAIAEAKRVQDAAEALVKGAKDYATAQAEVAARTGLTARELRLYADAAAIAKAPTEELRQAIKDAAAAREQSIGLEAREQFETNVLQPLRDEMALYGKVGPERERMALELEKQSFLLKQVGVSGEVALAMWEQYRTLKLSAFEQREAGEKEQAELRAIGEQLSFVAGQWDILAGKVETAARGMADAFGPVGEAIGDVAAIYGNFQADQVRQQAEHHARIVQAGKDDVAIERERARFALVNSNKQVGLYGDMAAAAKGFFSEKSAGFKAITAAEKVFRAFEFAQSVRAMLQGASETVASVTNSAARAAAAGAEGVATQAKLPFPANIAAMAATGAALVAAGIAVLGPGGGGAAQADPGNLGRGTVLGDAEGQSESIKRAIDALKEVDNLMLSSSREMAASLRSIDSQIGGVASQILRAGEVGASSGISEGFKPNAIGSVLGAIPLVGGLLKSLFGSSTTITGGGLFGGPQSLDSILADGFKAQTYSDVLKTSKFLGIKTGSKTSTQYGAADGALTDQFSLIIREFDRALTAAAGPLGVATDEIERRLGGFIVNIGKIDLKGLSGEQVQEKLGAIFGAAADRLASTAFPGIDRFQRAGEGLFETAVRVSSTVEQVSASLGMLGTATAGLGIDAQVALAGQFEGVNEFATAAQGYFERFYTAQEQAAARASQFEGVFASLGVAMPSTLAAFRGLVEAQNLTTAAGRETYATLLQLAPAFADMQAALNGARSAADILTERADLERKLLEVQGNAAAIRALDLAKLDPANRALQQQIWALQDAQEAARAADDLRKAWTDVGNSIEDEVRRIRGLNDAGVGGSFASASGAFNAATNAARLGDQTAAKSLPGLSQALLKLAADNATSRQELDRVQAQTANSLEQTLSVLAGRERSTAQILEAVSVNQAATTTVQPRAANDIADLRAELAQSNESLRKEIAAGLATIAGNTGKIARKLDDVTTASGGDAISTQAA